MRASVKVSRELSLVTGIWAYREKMDFFTSFTPSKQLINKPPFPILS